MFSIDFAYKRIFCFEPAADSPNLHSSRVSGTELAFSDLGVTGAANASNYGISHPDAAATETEYFPPTEI
jgi:hypothetical protein